MKLADAPAEVVAILAQRRDWRARIHGWSVHPEDGSLWFAEGCAVDGGRGVGDRDHCHVTGLYRGQLCHSCNLDEGFNTNAMWEHWRLNAPGLEERRIHHHGDVSEFLDSDEVLTLAMAELFAIHAECEEIRRRESAPRIRAALDRRMAALFSGSGPS
jgi:hypothetical protein